MNMADMLNSFLGSATLTVKDDDPVLLPHRVTVQPHTGGKVVLDLVPLTMRRVGESVSLSTWDEAISQKSKLKA